jgi:hypothetical protein
MYSKLYFIIYAFFKAKKNHDPEFSTVGIVFISQIIHVFLLLLVVKHFIAFEIPKYSNDSAINKLAFFPIGIIWLIIVYYYFKNKIEKMFKRFNKVTLTNIQFAILIIFVIILPLYSVIILSGGEVWK